MICGGGLLAAVALFGSGQADAASLLSGNVSITNNYPTFAAVFAGPVSGPTVDGINLVGFTFTFTNNTITYTTPYSGPYNTYGPGGYNGFELTFTGVPTITGVSLDPASQTFNPPTGLMFSSNTVDIAFNGGMEVPGQSSIIDVATGVPEPATWAMLLLGVGLVGAGLRVARLKDGSAPTAA